MNGELRGKAPLELKLSPGDYTIRLRKDNYVAIEQAEWQITAKAGRVTTIGTTFRERRYKTITDRFYIGVGVSGLVGGVVEGELLSMSMPGSFFGAGADLEFNQIYAGIHWYPNLMVPIYEGSVFTTHAGWRFRLGGGFAIGAHYTHKFVNLDKMARDDYYSDYEFVESLDYTAPAWGAGDRSTCAAFTGPALLLPLPSRMRRFSKQGSTGRRRSSSFVRS